MFFKKIVEFMLRNVLSEKRGLANVRNNSFRKTFALRLTLPPAPWLQKSPAEVFFRNYSSQF